MSTEDEKLAWMQTVANGAADSFLLRENLYDRLIEAASEEFTSCRFGQGAPAEQGERKLGEDDRRTFIIAFLRGIIQAVERECNDLPATLPVD